MRFIRNDIQTPKMLVPAEKRKTISFYILFIGVVIFVIGTAAFFSAFFFRDLIQEQWGFYYRDVQTKSIYTAGIGVFLYIIGAFLLKVPLRKTTYYKINTIMKNEPFDPPRKGDFTKPIYARLRDLDDDWAFFYQVKPQDAPAVIPQVLVGPGGVFTIQPISDNPERKAFVDPGPDFEKATKKLGNAIGQSVLPIVVFSNPKLVSLYRTYCDPKTRVMNIRDIYDYFEKRKKKLSGKVQKEVEEKVFALIEGAPPGA